MLAMRKRSLRLLALFLLFSISALAASPGSYQVFVGTYTGPQSKGIYSFQFDPSTGKATAPQLAAETENPSFLAIDPHHHFLYAVNEVGNYRGTNSGAVSVFALDPASWKLTFLQQVPSLGADPAYVTLDNSGKDLLVANYTGGNVAVFPIQPDGKLGEHTSLDQHHGSSVDPERQKEPHAHSIQMTNDNRFALSADLGTDKVVIDRFDAAHGTLIANQPPSASVEAGAGPRHVAFAPSGKFVYVLNEMATTVDVFALDPHSGAMRELQTIPTVEKHDPANTGAEILLDRPGRFLYTSTRAIDIITEYAVDKNSGKLTLVARTSSVAKTPRFFTLDPTGQWMFVAGQDSNDIAIFRVDKTTGKLTPADTRVEVGAPVCLVFVPTS